MQTLTLGEGGGVRMCHLIVVYNMQPALPVYAIKFFLLLLSQITVNFEDRTSLLGEGRGSGSQHKTMLGVKIESTN